MIFFSKLHSRFVSLLHFTTSEANELSQQPGKFAWKWQTTKDR